MIEVSVETISQLGFPIVMSLLMWRFISRSSSKTDIVLEKLIGSIDKLSYNVGKTLLDSSQTLIVFKSVMHEHIERKLSYVHSVLENNNIKNRRKQIEKNLHNKFMDITRSEAAKLATFNTPAGDLGRILLDEVNYNKFMSEVYEIFFSQSKDYIKESDLKSLMLGYVTNLVEVIENKIRDNSF